MELNRLANSEITPEGVFKNRELIFKNQHHQPFSIFSKEIYQRLEKSYPKFFKMDELCKLAFLAVEVLLGNQPLESEMEGADIALLFGNRSSSFASDLRHQEALKDKAAYFPSPAVFVYTLPNIMLGEICIRHQITGENSCFIMDSFDEDFLMKYAKDLIENEGYNQVILGFVDYKEDAYEARLSLLAKGN